MLWGVSVPRLAECCSKPGGGGICHRLLVSAERVPVMTALDSSTGTGSLVTMTWFLVNTAVQLASQNLPIEIRLVSSKAGRIWALVAVDGRLGMGKDAVCVEEMVVLPATVTSIGLGFGCIFCGSLLFGDIKWPVVPVSATLRVTRRWGGTYKATDGLGGPTVFCGSTSCSILGFAT